MSRVAKSPVKLPKNAECTIENQVITVKGPKGTLSYHFHNLVTVTKAEDAMQLVFGVASNDSNAWVQAGTTRALVQNMVQGVTEGFVKTLELVGVGYRAQAQGKSVNLSVGYSHPIEYKLPQGIVAETPSNTIIILKGIDKQLIGQVAAEIRRFQPPEPYKGKGIKYDNEIIIRKEAKKK